MTGLSKPYHRIYIPNQFQQSNGNHYVLNNYPDRHELIRSYLNITKELIDIFDYIEPAEDNLPVYSIKLYQLLLRACTEVELNFKKILYSNNYHGNNNFLTITDYKKIEQSSLLSKYKIEIKYWRKYTKKKNVIFTSRIFKPFICFSQSNTSKGNKGKPSWWYAYNQVKHNREANLRLANLENCINAVGSILILLYSQFGYYCIENEMPGLSLSMLIPDELTLGNKDYTFDNSPLFILHPPRITDWGNNKLYNFDSTNKNISFANYPFK